MAMLSRVLARVGSAAELQARVSRVAKREGREARSDPRELVAYVNHGRWVADCPSCGAGIAVHPGWTATACLGEGCGWIYSNVTVPARWRAIESALQSRDLILQNWLPGETVDDLEEQTKVIAAAAAEKRRR